MSIYVHTSVKFTNINLQDQCKEQDIEICAVKLNIKDSIIIVLGIYRSPSGQFDCFLHTLENIMNVLYNNKIEFIICGDVNINYLDNCSKKQQMNNLLATFDLSGVVNFLTRIANNSVSMIDNIFINKKRKYNIKPCINGLSDHDAQLLILYDIPTPKSNTEPSYIRFINKSNLEEFLTQLSFERWDDVFGEDEDVNVIFNNFLNTYLRIYNSNFCKKKITSNYKYNTWLTKGIKISC